MAVVVLDAVKVAQEGFESPLAGERRFSVAPQVPFAHHMRLVSRVVHVLGHNLLRGQGKAETKIESARSPSQ